MLTLSADTLAHATRGRLVCGSSAVLVRGISVDSRSVADGDVFVALPGERVDGHEFLGEALARGAAALLVARPVADLGTIYSDAMRVGAAIVEVDDALRAIQELASWQRGKLAAEVVGVTGSTGKTTTKDLLTTVLADVRRTVATKGNRNNELGAPLTLLDADADTEVLVVEMAMRGLGEIARLAEIARPTLGLVTNVGQSHIEGVGSEDAVAVAKGELVSSIPEDGAVFLNADDARSDELAQRTKAAVIRYGTVEAADVRAESIRLDDASLPSFELVSDGVRTAVSLQVAGRHNVYNALAAAAVALRLGVPADKIVAGLARARATDMRMETFITASGITVINDAYNANPASMRAAVDTLAGIRTDGARVAILGDMAELGSLTDLAHFRLGEHVAGSHIERLVTVGRLAARIAEGARAAGMPKDAVAVFTTLEETAGAISGLAQAGDTVLVKASRIMGLERLVDRLVSPDAP